MRQLLATLLICPLAAVAADWQYADRPAAPDENAAAGGETAAAAAMAVPRNAGPAPPGAPGSSLTMAQVRAANGEPERTFGAVGEPPITRWQYAGYVVYFEHDRVITSVGGRW